MTLRVMERKVESDGKTVGVKGDHLSETVRFLFDREPIGSVYLKVSLGSYKSKLLLETTDNVAVWNVASAPLATSGSMKCQIQMENDEYNPKQVWQSEIFELKVLDTLSV